ncbi:MAG: glycosyltransferase family 2 protein [Xanthomonadales bacterium]|nr:glycosyltransferase family 2 protein [Xanthomonadales bacterium]
MRVLILIPCHNESESIGHLLDEIKDLHKHLDVLVINDGSTDNSLDVIRQRAHVKVLNLPYNTGIGATVQTGFQWALKNDYDAVIRLDGDGQHPPADIPAHLKALEQDQADMIIGSRFLKAHNIGYQSTLPRRLGIYYLRHLLKLLTGQRIFDPTSGFISCNRKVIRWFAEYYPYDYPEPEAIQRVKQCDGRILEIPTSMRKRLAGKSKISTTDSFYYFIKVSLALIMFHGRKCHERDI